MESPGTPPKIANPGRGVLGDSKVPEGSKVGTTWSTMSHVERPSHVSTSGRTGQNCKGFKNPFKNRPLE